MAASSTSTNLGNMVVVTHVVPAAATGVQQPLPDRGFRFKRGQPTALGTVQIMIGLMVLLFGIAMVVYQPLLGVLSGIFVWGSLIYIASGSVTVAADKYLSRCLMTASLVLNVIAAVVAGIGVILYGVDGGVMWYYSRGAGYQRGFSFVLAVFQFLQFVVSIIVAGNSCNEVCRCCREEPNIIVRTADGALTPLTPPQINTGPVASAQPHPQVGPHYKSPDLSTTEPPPYQLAP